MLNVNREARWALPECFEHKLNEPAKVGHVKAQEPERSTFVIDFPLH